jgi:cytochrome c biogenesis factor
VVALLALALALLLAAVAWRLIARKRGAAAAPAVALWRAGAQITHAGLALAALAAGAGAFRRSYELSLAPGETRTVVDPFGGRWRLASNGLSRISHLNHDAVVVALTAAREGASGRDGPLPLVTAERRLYLDTRDAPTAEAVAVPGVLTSLREDVSAVLADVGAEEQATVRVTFTPLVAWIWLGATAATFGGILLLVPRPAGGRER